MSADLTILQAPSWGQSGGEQKRKSCEFQGSNSDCKNFFKIWEEKEYINLHLCLVVCIGCYIPIRKENVLNHYYM